MHVHRLVEPSRRDAVSPAAILATQLREALAANTIGGRAEDESKARAAEQEPMTPPARPPSGTPHEQEPLAPRPTVE